MMSYLTGLQYLDVFLKNCVTVLLDETFDLVLNTVGKVMNNISRSRHTRLLKVHMSPMFTVQLLTPVLI